MFTRVAVESRRSSFTAKIRLWKYCCWSAKQKGTRRLLRYHPPGTQERRVSGLAFSSEPFILRPEFATITLKRLQISNSETPRIYPWQREGLWALWACALSLIQSTNMSSRKIWRCNRVSKRRHGLKMKRHALAWKNSPSPRSQRYIFGVNSWVSVCFEVWTQWVRYNRKFTVWYSGVRLACISWYCF